MGHLSGSSGHTGAGRSRLFWNISCLVIVMGVATIGGFLFERVMDNTNYLALNYVLAVLIVARLTDGYFWGIAASVIGVIGTNYFFAYPYFKLDFTQAGYPITFAGMLIVSLVTSASTGQIKRQAQSAMKRESRTNMLYRMSTQLLVTQGEREIMDLTVSALRHLYGCTVAAWLGDPASSNEQTAFCSSPISYQTDPVILETAHKTFSCREPIGLQNQKPAPGAFFYLPLVSGDSCLGVVGILDTEGIFADGSPMASLQILLSLVVMTLERQHLADAQQKIQVESEMEKMRANLLRAVSHDLRTPLTGIVGSASTLLENGDLLDKKTHDKMLTEVCEDAQWLIRMVENLLSVTRISSDSGNGCTTVKKSPELAEEIVGGAISRIRKRFPGFCIHAHVPDEVLMVPMDGTLIEQVLINLMENAIRHSGGDTIEVEVTREDQFAVFSVADNGKGIDPKRIPTLFKGYLGDQKISSDSSRGMGIGLSICRSIIHAHDGSLSVQNKPEGGSIFTFELPIEGDDPQ